VLPNPLPAMEAAQRVPLSPGATTVSPVATTLRDSERTLILQTLEAVRWVIGGPKGAAAKLGLARTTLIHRMQKLGISRPALQNEENVMPASQRIPSPPQLQ
jgi:transcriptional regulator with GAF, ATPase, and Fis domain